jgi:hypothetical protein
MIDMKPEVVRSALVLGPIYIYIIYNVYKQVMEEEEND